MNQLAHHFERLNDLLKSRVVTGYGGGWVQKFQILINGAILNHCL